MRRLCLILSLCTVSCTSTSSEQDAGSVEAGAQDSGADAGSVAADASIHDGAVPSDSDAQTGCSTPDGSVAYGDAATLPDADAGVTPVDGGPYLLPLGCFGPSVHMLERLDGQQRVTLAADEHAIAIGKDLVLVSFEQPGPSGIRIRSLISGLQIWEVRAPGVQGGFANDGSFLWTYAAGVLRAYDITSAGVGPEWLTVEGMFTSFFAAKDRLQVSRHEGTSEAVLRYGRTGPPQVGAPYVGPLLGWFADGESFITASAVHDWSGSIVRTLPEPQLFDGRLPTFGAGLGDRFWLYFPGPGDGTIWRFDEPNMGDTGPAGNVGIGAKGLLIALANGGYAELNVPYGDSYRTDLTSAAWSLSSHDPKPPSLSTASSIVAGASGIYLEGIGRESNCGRSSSFAASQRLYVVTETAGVFAYEPPITNPVAHLDTVVGSSDTLRVASQSGHLLIQKGEPPMGAIVYDRQLHEIASFVYTRATRVSISPDGALLGQSYDAIPSETSFSQFGHWDVLRLADRATLFSSESAYSGRPNYPPSPPAFSPSGERVSIGASNDPASQLINNSSFFDLTGARIGGATGKFAVRWLSEDRVLSIEGFSGNLWTIVGLNGGSFGTISCHGQFGDADGEWQQLSATMVYARGVVCDEAAVTSMPMPATELGIPTYLFGAYGFYAGADGSMRFAPL